MQYPHREQHREFDASVGQQRVELYALDLRTASNESPMRVSGIRRVPRLNADRVDGKHASTSSVPPPLQPTRTC